MGQRNLHHSAVHLRYGAGNARGVFMVRLADRSINSLTGGYSMDLFHHVYFAFPRVYDDVCTIFLRKLESLIPSINANNSQPKCPIPAPKLTKHTHSPLFSLVFSTILQAVRPAQAKGAADMKETSLSSFALMRESHFTYSAKQPFVCKPRKPIPRFEQYCV